MHQILSGAMLEQKNQLDSVVYQSLLSGSVLLKPRNLLVHAAHYLRYMTHVGVEPILFRKLLERAQMILL